MELATWCWDVLMLPFPRIQCILMYSWYVSELMKLMNTEFTAPKRAGVASLKRPPCTKIKDDQRRTLHPKNAQHKAHERDEKRFGQMRPMRQLLFMTNCARCLERGNMCRKQPAMTYLCLLCSCSVPHGSCKLQDTWHHGETMTSRASNMKVT